MVGSSFKSSGPLVLDIGFSAFQPNPAVVHDFLSGSRCTLPKATVWLERSYNIIRCDEKVQHDAVVSVNLPVKSSARYVLWLFRSACHLSCTNIIYAHSTEKSYEYYGEYCRVILQIV